MMLRARKQEALANIFVNKSLDGDGGNWRFVQTAQYRPKLHIYYKKSVRRVFSFTALVHILSRNTILYPRAFCTGNPGVQRDNVGLNVANEQAPHGGGACSLYTSIGSYSPATALRTAVRSC
jgi:hypothetical protein